MALWILKPPSIPQARFIQQRPLVWPHPGLETWEFFCLDEASSHGTLLAMVAGHGARGRWPAGLPTHGFAHARLGQWRLAVGLQLGCLRRYRPCAAVLGDFWRQLSAPGKSATMPSSVSDRVCHHTRGLGYKDPSRATSRFNVIEHPNYPHLYRYKCIYIYIYILIYTQAYNYTCIYIYIYTYLNNPILMTHPLVMTNILATIAIENHHTSWIYDPLLAIFHSYVSSPEGKDPDGSMAISGTEIGGTYHIWGLLFRSH